MKSLATPLYVIENPDSLAAHQWWEFIMEWEKATAAHHGSAPRNNPAEYITLGEVARQIGVKHETMTLNATNRPEYFPFTAIPDRGPGKSQRERYYHRKPVEIWIAKYLERKAQRAARAWGHEAGRGNPA